MYWSFIPACTTFPQAIVAILSHDKYVFHPFCSRNNCMVKVFLFLLYHVLLQYPMTLTLTQVLAGDIEEAICTHAVYYSIWRRYSALPERFDWNTKSPNVKFYPLRPELVESTYLLYQARPHDMLIKLSGQLSSRHATRFIFLRRQVH